jgi:preprotein translocase subunit SecG
MASVLIGLFTAVLVLVCVFMTVIILMQRSSANAGMGTALGGGAAESVFGGETANVLLKNTIIVAVLFFVLSFGLYLGTIAHVKHKAAATGGLPTFGTPAKAQTLPSNPANTTTTGANTAAANSTTGTSGSIPVTITTPTTNTTVQVPTATTGAPSPAATTPAK